MLNPRVVNFKPPPLNICYKEGNCISDSSSIVQTISDHFFNFSVSLILPDCMSVPSNIEDILTIDSEYYSLSAVPIHQLISQDFIDYFIKEGEVTAVSVNTCLDTDNCVAVTPCGHLVMSIDDRTYQQLALISSPAVHVKQNHKKSKFVVINLKTPCFKIGSRNYDKLYEQWKNISLKFDLIIAWEPTDTKVCPSSIAKYFNRLNLDVKECAVEEFKRLSYNVKLPLLKVDHDELFEWFGALLFDIKGSLPSELDEDFTHFETPEPNEDMGQVVVANWTGLFTRKRILTFFNEIKELAAGMSEVPWIGFGVLGFLDTPVAWGLNPHSFRISGENDYTILINHEGQYVLCKNTETYCMR